MKKKGDIWMPLYISDYLGDTMHLTTAQHGAYLLLLMGAWKRGASLPDNDEQLAQIARCDLKAWRAMRPVLEEFFDVVDGEWTQKRLAAEFIRAGGIVSKRKEAGKKGAAKRWQSDAPDDGKTDGTAMANAMANGMANGSQSAWQPDAPSQSPPPKPTVNQGGGDATSIAREAPPPAHPPSAFRMHADWRPSPNFASVCRNAGLSPPDGQDLAARVAEFVAFWLTQDRQRSQPEWDHALLKSLKSDQLRASGVPKNANRPRRADQLSATERNIRTIAGLTGRDREPERDPEHIDGTAVRVD